MGGRKGIVSRTIAVRSSCAFGTFWHTLVVIDRDFRPERGAVEDGLYAEPSLLFRLFRPCFILFVSPFRGSLLCHAKFTTLCDVYKLTFTTSGGVYNLIFTSSCDVYNLMFTTRVWTGAHRHHLCKSQEYFIDGVTQDYVEKTWNRSELLREGGP